MIHWLPARVDGETWLANIYAEGARRLGVRPLGTGRANGSGVSMGGSAEAEGITTWLRVGAFLESEMDREVWTGTHDAAALCGVAKPALLAETTWTHPDPMPVPVRADLLTLVTDPTVVPADAYGAGQYPPTEPDLPDIWWTELRASVDALADATIDRTLWSYDPDTLAHLVHARVGALPAHIAPGPPRVEHLDLHWGNITAPGFVILDWEHWARSVPGIGAATLYLTALRHAPRTAARVYETFPELDTPPGRYARLVTCLRTLDALSWTPDEMDLAGTIRAHLDDLLDR